MSAAHIAALAAALSLQGCAALVPNTVSPEFEQADTTPTEFATLAEALKCAWKHLEAYQRGRAP